MNTVRVAHHLAPLRLDWRLERAARSHSVDMLRRNYFDHRSFAARMRAFRATGPTLGENLAWGTGSRATAGVMVAEWLSSPEHRTNLLRPGFRRIGIGAFVGRFLRYSGARVVTADFGGR